MTYFKMNFHMALQNGEKTACIPQGIEREREIDCAGKICVLVFFLKLCFIYTKCRDKNVNVFGFSSPTRSTHNFYLHFKLPFTVWPITSILPFILKTFRELTHRVVS